MFLADLYTCTSCCVSIYKYIDMSFIYVHRFIHCMWKDVEISKFGIPFHPELKNSCKVLRAPFWRQHKVVGVSGLQSTRDFLSLVNLMIIRIMRVQAGSPQWKASPRMICPLCDWLGKCLGPAYMLKVKSTKLFMDRYKVWDWLGKLWWHEIWNGLNTGMWVAKCNQKGVWLRIIFWKRWKGKRLAPMFLSSEAGDSPGTMAFGGPSHETLLCPCAWKGS